MSTRSIFLTLPTAIVSAIITLMTTYLAVFIVHHWLSVKKAESPPPPIKLVIAPTNSNTKLQKKHVHSNSVPSASRPRNKSTTSDTSSSESRPKKVFTYLASSIVIFSAINTAFNTVYCVWLVFDPQKVDELYIYHPSHIHRVISTVCWYIAKILFVWLLGYRLYYSFKGSIFHVDKRLILCLSITNSIVGPIGLCIAFWTVYGQHDPIITEFAFNFWRILYQIIVFIILYMFCKRLLHLVTENEMHLVVKSQENGTVDQRTHTGCVQRQHSSRVSSDFLEIIARHSLLVLTISLTVAMTMFCFFGFRFIFLPQTCLTLLIPMNMAALDSLITSICIVCLFPMGKKVYSVLCHGAHASLKRVCLYLAKRALTE
eukprot:241196_1